MGASRDDRARSPFHHSPYRIPMGNGSRCLKALSQWHHFREGPVADIDLFVVSRRGLL
jgi:hypothetical protein